MLVERGEVFASCLEVKVVVARSRSAGPRLVCELLQFGSAHFHRGARTGQAHCGLPARQWRRSPRPTFLAMPAVPDQGGLLE